MTELKYFIISALLLCSALASAGPAKQVCVSLTQPDGTMLVATLMGDEYLHYYIDADGDMLTQDDNGYYRKCTMWEEADARQRGISKVQEANRRRSARNALARSRSIDTKAAQSFQPTPHIGEDKGLVILINFSDTKMRTLNAQDEFHKAFNMLGYNQHNHIGSVRDYFIDQSYGQYDITFDVVGPVTLSKNEIYYGKNDEIGDDIHPAEMVIEACKLVDSQVDFSKYDNDGDGYVDQIYCIFAGYSEAEGAPTYTIWPHEADLEIGLERNDGDGPIFLDGVTINTYACSSELAGSRGTNISGIGVACHEFAHILGLMDTYTYTTGWIGMENYDIMAAGEYCGPNQRGEVPCGFTAFERWQAGWLTPIELSSPTTIDAMPELQDTAVAYILYNEGNRDEFFLLENRQSRGWFKYLNTYTGAHGLLVTHIDYDEEAWLDNAINDWTDHQHMTIVPAGGKSGITSSYLGSLSKSQHLQNFFPGSLGVTELTDLSHQDCGGKLFNKNSDGTFAMHKPITDIAEADGLISFAFMGGAKTVVTINDITELIARYLNDDNDITIDDITALIDRYLAQED